MNNVRFFARVKPTRLIVITKRKRFLQYQTMEVQAKLARSRHEAFRDKNDLLTQQERLNVLLGRDINKQFS